MDFPRGFYFGASASSHQVEGGNHNDWTEWENKNAERLAKEAQKKNWPDYILKNYPNPLQAENYFSGKATDHYNRYEEDFDLAKELGHNAHRFSLEWSRIEPEEGKFDEREVEHYRQVVKALRDRGLEPFVTLWHWTLPLWLRDKGGISTSGFPRYFARYAERMAKALLEVRFWITLNETNVYTSRGYLSGDWPPGRHSPLGWLRANRRLSRAHIAAYRVIKKLNPDSQIGVAHNFIWFTRGCAGIKHFFWNKFFLRRIKNHQDFVGLNYYYSDREAKERSEFQNWPIDPQGMYSALKYLSGYGKPIYITENGIADARDARRSEFIKGHLENVHRAILDGVDVRGYFYWSLLDNFEWSSGFWPRFGLVEIDYKTLKRKVRPSALIYRDLIKNSQ